MLTPFARPVISRIRCLNRSKAFGAMARLTSGPAVKLNPRNFRSCGRATALFASFTRSEEHTSELQSLRHLVCRLLLETINVFCWGGGVRIGVGGPRVNVAQVGEA